MLLAIATAPLISVTRNNGLEGVSIYNIFVSGLIYFSTFSILVVSTKSTSNPKRVNTLLKRGTYHHIHLNLK